MNKSLNRKNCLDKKNNKKYYYMIITVIDGISFFALGILVLSYLAQIIKIVQRKSAEDVSYLFTLGVIFEYSIWAWYAFSYGGYLAFISNIFSIFSVIVIMCLKYYYSTLIKKKFIKKYADKFKIIRVKAQP